MTGPNRNFPASLDGRGGLVRARLRSTGVLRHWAGPDLPRGDILAARGSPGPRPLWRRRPACRGIPFDDPSCCRMRYRQPQVFLLRSTSTAARCPGDVASGPHLTLMSPERHGHRDRETCTGRRPRGICRPWSIAETDPPSSGRCWSRWPFCRYVHGRRCGAPASAGMQLPGASCAARPTRRAPTNPGEVASSSWAGSSRWTSRRSRRRCSSRTVLWPASGSRDEVLALAGEECRSSTSARTWRTRGSSMPTHTG